MKLLLPLLCWLLPAIALSQAKDSVTTGIFANTTMQATKPEIFNNGFIDVMNNGQVNA
jgi:hypothetical protein